MIPSIAVILEYITLAIDLLTVVVIVFGVLLFIYDFINQFLTSEVRDLSHILDFKLSRVHLGNFLLAALELLIAADIIETIITHSLESLYFLALVVVIRTIISHFLSKEIEAFEKANASNVKKQ